MAIQHAVSGQAIDVRPLGGSLPTTKTTALFKSDDFEVMRVVLVVGKSLPPHRVPGEVTIQCIEGALAVSVDGHSRVLRAGQLLFLSGNVTHGLSALEDASALVTVALKK